VRNQVGGAQGGPIARRNRLVLLHRGPTRGTVIHNEPSKDPTSSRDGSTRALSGDFTAARLAGVQQREARSRLTRAPFVKNKVRTPSQLDKNALNAIAQYIPVSKRLPCGRYQYAYPEDGSTDNPVRRTRLTSDKKREQEINVMEA